MQFLRKFYDLIRKLDNFLGMAAMGFIIVLACANVFMRYAIGRPWGWVEEITVFTFVWLSMLGASAVIHVEGHCSIDVMVTRLPAKYQRIVSLIADAIVLITLCLLIWFGILLTIRGYTKLTPMLGIPYSYIDAAIPVCCSFMLMYYSRMFWNSLRGKKNTTDLDEELEESAP
jgi:TRAP-type C4-dicarboxylate transport system permease small subunit